MTTIAGFQVDLQAMKPSTCGMVGNAFRDGKQFFCKQFNAPVLPGNTNVMGKKTIEKNRKMFEEFRRRKVRVNNALREISGTNENIVFPIQETVYNNHWMEFSEYIEGVIPEEEYYCTIATMTEQNKLVLLKLAIGALQDLHAQRLIHGDLKLTNIMLVKNTWGVYVPKIIDFDGAFFENDIPIESIIGTIDYYSPELAIYSNTEDQELRRKVSRYITTKSDIFTMGLVLHEILSGEKPHPDGLPSKLQKMKSAGKFIFPWQLLLIRDEGYPPFQLVLSRKITEPAYIALISDMLCLEPEQRPTAEEVMHRLTSKKLPIETDAWPDDRIIIHPHTAKEQFVALRRATNPVSICTKKRLYEGVIKDGRRYTYTASELIEMGVASLRDAWTSPNEYDGITWNYEQLKKNFVSVSPGKDRGIYVLTDKNGVKRKMNCNQLKLLHLASAIPVLESSAEQSVSTNTFDVVHTVSGLGVTSSKFLEAEPISAISDDKTHSTVESANLRPEDAELYVLNRAYLDNKKISFLGPAELLGVKGYSFQMADEKKVFMTVQNCKAMTLILPRE